MKKLIFSLLGVALVLSFTSCFSLSAAKIEQGKTLMVYTGEYDKANPVTLNETSYFLNGLNAEVDFFIPNIDSNYRPLTVRYLTVAAVQPGNRTVGFTEIVSNRISTGHIDDFGRSNATIRTLTTQSGEFTYNFEPGQYYCIYYQDGELMFNKLSDADSVFLGGSSSKNGTEVSSESIIRGINYEIERQDKRVIYYRRLN